MCELLLYFDGGCEPRNPGGVATSAYCLLFPDGATWHEEARVVAEGPGATNNVAEWCALGFGLRFVADNVSTLAEMKASRLIIRGDSSLVINQLIGVFECRNDRMRKFRDRSLELLTIIQATGCLWAATWIPRAENQRADALGRRAYERHTGRRYPERRKARAER